VGGAPGFVAVSSIIGTVTVADRSAPQVVVVDTISAKPIARVPLRTGNPQFLVMSPDGRLLYASTWNDAQRTGAVEVLDTNTHVTVATIPVPFRPQKAAIRPDGRQLYLPGGGAVLVIDTTKNTVVRRIAVPIEPRWVEFAPDGRTAYVAGAAMAVVSVINTATGAVRSGPTMPAGPAVALAVSPDARFIAAVNQGNNAVTLMNTAADTVVATVPVGASPSSVAWTPDRRSALVANADGTVTEIDPGFDPPYSTRRTYVPGGDKFSSIAVQSGTATVYLTDPTRGQLITFVTR
jgi:YVTN family beta-propeller protein